MQDYQMEVNLPEAPLSTNAYVEIAGVKHQITARGTTADEMTSKYFDAIDTLKAAYAARSKRPAMDTGKLFILLQCGMEKAAKAGDFERAKRLVKAGALVQNGAVEREGEGYTVRSQTDASKAYTVNADFACTCTDWQRHAENTETYWCKHSLACMLMSRLTIAS